jgi:hypothetical protein
MSDHELEAKFRRLVIGRLGRSRTEQVIRHVWKLDQMRHIGTLMPLLKVSP